MWSGKNKHSKELTKDQIQNETKLCSACRNNAELCNVLKIENISQADHLSGFNCSLLYEEKVILHAKTYLNVSLSNIF